MRGRAFRLSVLFLLLSLGSFRLAAAPIRSDEIPPALREWTDWALHGEESRTCPFLYNRPEEHRCAWPSALRLELDAEGGRFSQSWEVHVESWITLPGDAANWPQDVTQDGRPAALVVKNNRPQLRLDAGRHAIAGTFRWNKLPESLAVPGDTGLITLSVAGRAITAPDIDDGGHLWLRDRTGGGGARAEAGNQVKLLVFRRVIDDIPLQIVTRVDLEVSGAQREETFAGALPEGFIPLRLNSRLPARLEADGRLRVQVRPGRWSIELTGRHPAELTALALQSWPEPWPREEVWVFDARNDLRLVEIEGPTSIDPRQSPLPDAWQELPAYLMAPGQEMKFNVVRRGDPAPEPDQLSLHRSLSLDFDGGGYTIQDTISGRMTSGWRLEMNAPTQLGRVSLDGEPQFITTVPGTERQGVEVRRGALALSADSRFEGSISDLPALGWNHDFHGVSAVLNLPPGWDLFSAGGVDNVPDTWIERWTLLDIFLVLIAALAVRGLWNWKFALLALVTLVLIWHEPGAPRNVWLNLLAAIALLRVLPQGTFLTLVKIYRNMAWLALVVIVVPFMVDQVRQGLYPQLEPIGFYPAIGQAAYADMQIVAAQEPPAAPEPAADAAIARSAPMLEKRMREDVAQESAAGSAGSLEEIVVTASSRNFAQVDPDANVQTGPGLPDWHWRQIPLSWNGPVQKDQQISLWLLSPSTNLVLNFIRVLLVVALALVTFGFTFTPGTGLRRAAAAVSAFLLLPGLVFHAPEARAEFPGPDLLRDLKTRLLEPPECLPECAQSPRLRFEIDQNSLSVRVEIHAAEAVAVPLPARAGLWSPEEIAVDGEAARGLMRDKEGTLWISLPAGAHQVVLRGAPASGASFQLPLPLVPRRVDFTVNGWSVEGVADGRPVGRQLQFTRIEKAAVSAEPSELRPRDLPPFVRVERELAIGLEWAVYTTVTRLSPPGAAVVIAVPLLEGESVTTDGVKVEDGKVLVNMAANQKSFEWESSLAKTPSISLTAPQTTDWTESWKADVSPIWHMETGGIAVVHHQDPDGVWLPEWRPWPGESVELNVTRPEGVSGRTLTIDQASLRTAPGKRATDTTLEVTLRSSRGGQHTLTLPPDVELQSVILDGVAQPIRQESGKVTLPLSPGTQHASLSFRSALGIGTLFRTPALDLAAPAVNTRLNVSLGQDRWALLIGGPRLGPAVLFWGVLLVVVLIAIGLGRIDFTPLRTWHWILLGVGLTQTSIGEAVIIVGWLLALGGRARLKGDGNRVWFNFVQIMLGVLTLLALTTLFNAVKHGLLGLPEMQITGNGSSAWDLNWYQDRSDAALPQAWVLSAPMWAYRGLMLAWALWLAFALLRWLRWGWECFGQGGLWKAKPRIEKTAA